MEECRLFGIAPTGGRGRLGQIHHHGQDVESRALRMPPDLVGGLGIALHGYHARALFGGQQRVFAVIGTEVEHLAGAQHRRGHKDAFGLVGFAIIVAVRLVAAPTRAPIQADRCVLQHLPQAAK